jgi:hypothetical protein
MNRRTAAPDNGRWGHRCCPGDGHDLFKESRKYIEVFIYIYIFRIICVSVYVHICGKRRTNYNCIYLVGGFKHVLFSISYMGCHPSHWLTFFRGVQTTKQIYLHHRDLKHFMRNPCCEIRWELGNSDQDGILWKTRGPGATKNELVICLHIWR